ncbi:allene oxide cyclase family protein [Polyangium jinanense]|uniref:allene-oxide cyclase n=1 Tax=Polyangium jinanense TaxID=2829994 RepID=A0A9X3WY29_9BACT|nr:allene oxide cyclase family protein [Polyangium jinanense]MDC3952823.1 Allene oxide cyclase [Polyangium jinanense]MDC3980442.1 Allene oxide cyclase [Polyangium jinanense]
MRNVFLLGCAVASAALVGCGDESNGAPAPDYIRKTIELVEHADNETVTHTDVAMMDSVGDILTFANPVFDKANANQVATDQGYCIRTEVGKSWECEWTMFLADGQISVAGPFFDTEESVLAITGGTGIYAQASGEMYLGFRDVAPPKVEYDFVYHVIVPY